MKKSLFVVGLLTISSMLLSAKSYDLTLLTATKVGKIEASQGSYTMYLEGDKLMLKDAHSKVVSVPVKVENGTGKKFSATSVESSHKDGTDAITAIHLGGSNTTLEFGD